jgi:hypothetical protein
MNQNTNIRITITSSNPMGVNPYRGENQGTAYRPIKAIGSAASAEEMSIVLVKFIENKHKSNSNPAVENRRLRIPVAATALDVQDIRARAYRILYKLKEKELWEEELSSIEQEMIPLLEGIIERCTLRIAELHQNRKEVMR